MSIKLMSLVWDLDLPDSEKIVLLALADRADDEGRCWPSVATLAKKCSKSERTVQAALRGLEAKGGLTRHEIPGKGCTYIVTPAAIAPVKPSHRCKEQRPTPAAAAPNTPVYTTVTKDTRATWPEWLPQEAWIAFLAMRKKIKAPLTEDGAKLAIQKLQKLAKLGHAPLDVLNQSVMHDWRGLFELRDGPSEAPAAEPSEGINFVKAGEADDASKFRRAIAEEVGTKTYRSWFEPMSIRIDGDRVALVAASAYAADYVRNNLGTHIQRVGKRLFAGSREVIILASTNGRKAA